MSNKDHAQLNVLDTVIRRVSRCGMDSGTIATIEFLSGFELFNTRPYHNYETWSQGYRVTGRGVAAEAEDLDDAVNTWAAILDKRENGEIESVPCSQNDGTCVRWLTFDRRLRCTRHPLAAPAEVQNEAAVRT